jgi:hypothetical protein
MHGCGQGATLRSADVAKPKSAEVAIKVGISDEFVLVSATTDRATLIWRFTTRMRVEFRAV